MSRVVTARWAVALTVALGLPACSNSPTAPTGSADTAAPITTPVVLSFTGLVAPSGTASRTFTAQLAGAATASLSGITPATALGLGFGIPRADGSGCLLGRSAVAVDGATARLSANVDPGIFCLQVYSPEGTADQVTFTVTLEHP